MCGNPIYLKHTIMHVAVAFGRIQLNSLHEVLFCLTLASLKKKKGGGKRGKIILTVCHHGAIMCSYNFQTPGTREKQLLLSLHLT